MRYSADQKRKTHDAIVAGAARLFRENGYSATGVDAVMAEAGLTVGGFYAHFKNKDALLAEAIASCQISLTGEPLPASTKPSHVSMEQFIDRYLSIQHRDRPGEGCPLPALAGELPRQRKKVRAASTAALTKRLNRLAQLQGTSKAATAEKRMDRAIEVLASAAGAMLLARAVDDEQLSQRILRVMRTALKRA